MDMKKYKLEAFLAVVAGIFLVCYTTKYWIAPAVEAHLVEVCIFGVSAVLVATTPIWWKMYLALHDHMHVRKINQQHYQMLAAATRQIEQGLEIGYKNGKHEFALDTKNPHLRAVKAQEATNQQIEGPKEVIPSVIAYSSIADQIPSDRSLLGIYPENGNLEIVEPERYKTTWFVGSSNMGKTNTVYGKVADMVQWGAKIIICDSHAFKKDSLANKLKDFHGRLLIPIAQTDEQIKNAIIYFLREFKARRDQGRPCTEKWLLVADEVNATANHMVRISKEEAASLLEEFGIKIEGEFVKLQVFFKFLAETCGYEARGFEMFGYFISQKVAGLAWLRNAMMTVFVHGLLMDSEALLAANNSRKLAELVKAFKVGRTLVYGLDFDPVILQQPKYEIVQISGSEGGSNNLSNSERVQPLQERTDPDFDAEFLQTQKSECDEGRIARITQHMIDGKSANQIIKEEWGLENKGRAHLAARNELREIQKVIASRTIANTPHS